MALVIVTLQGPKGEAIGEESVNLPLVALEPAEDAAAGRSRQALSCESLARDLTTELRTLRFSLTSDLRSSWLAQRTGPESF